MEIIRAKHMGFCFGVGKAIDICREVINSEENKKNKVYILGMIVHNETVVEKLKKEGFLEITEEDILEGKDILQKDDIVIVRAHGTTKKIFDILNNKGIKIVDATCIFVNVIRKTLVEMEKQGNEIIFIGDKEHPEVKGIMSFGKKVKIYMNLEELKKATILPEKKYCLLTQTTLNKKKLNEIKSYLEKFYKNVKILDKVCSATQVRQEAVTELAKTVDILIVIGGKNSSNTRKLYEISSEINKSTYLVEKVEDLKIGWFEKKEKVGITAGASTPEEIIIEIENWIRGIFNE